MENPGVTLKRMGVVHWLYNELIQEGYIDRPFEPDDYAQRKMRIEDVLKELKQHNMYKEEALYRRLEATVKSDNGFLGLRDEDINWVKNISKSELFAVWVRCRNSIAIDRDGKKLTSHIMERNVRAANREDLPLTEFMHLKLHADEQQTMYEPSNGGLPPAGVYGLSNLPLTSSHEGSMRSDVIDFLCSWSPAYNECFKMVEALQRFVASLRQQDYLSWMQEVSGTSNVDWIWQYLRNEHGMPGAFAEPMKTFGKARVYGVFVNWRGDRDFLLGVSEKARLAYRRKQNSTKSGKKERTNLTLDVQIKKKLHRLSTDSGLTMSEVVEKLIVQSNGVGAKYDL